MSRPLGRGQIHADARRLDMILKTGSGSGGSSLPTDSCWLYCRAIGTVYGGTDSCLHLVSPGGDYNTALGYQSMYYNETGDYNTVIGAQAGYGATGQSYLNNTLVGYRAAYELTLGRYNVAVGQMAMGNNRTGRDNVTVGYRAGEGTLGSSNYWNNVVIGSNAARDLEGDHNVFIGYSAGRTAAHATENVVIGPSAVFWNAFTGDYNTVVGASAGANLSNGDYNSIFGNRAGHAVTTGTYNSVLGYQAGDLITTGTHCICIGQNADPPAAGSTYRMNIGDTIYADLSATNNTVGINASTINAQLHVDQDEAAGTRPVLLLDQADVSEEMIEFVSTIGVGNAIEAVGAKTLTVTHFIKVTLPGPLTRYIPAGTIA